MGALLGLRLQLLLLLLPPVAGVDVVERLTLGGLMPVGVVTTADEGLRAVDDQLLLLVGCRCRRRLSRLGLERTLRRQYLDRRIVVVDGESAQMLEKIVLLEDAAVVVEALQVSADVGIAAETVARLSIDDAAPAVLRAAVGAPMGREELRLVGVKTAVASEGPRVAAGDC